MSKVTPPRWAWALTGSGHFFTESMEIIRDLGDVDLFISAAAAEVLRRHPQIGKARLVVGREDANDTMTLRCESPESGEALAASVRETLAAVTKLKGVVEFAAPGSLPNDGKVIEDARA